MTCKKLPVMWIGSCREIICNRYKHCSQRCQHCPHFTKTQWSTCLLMKCLNGFSSASSGIFSMERSTEEHRELFLDAEIFLVAIFSLFSCPVSIFLASTFSNFTLVSHEEIRCRLASARCDRLYRAEVSEATGPTSAHSREAVQYPSSQTKFSDRNFFSTFVL